MNLTIPESLQQFKIDWSKYVAPGGNRFAENYHEHLKFAISQARSICTDARAKAALLTTDLNRLADMAKSIRDFSPLFRKTCGDTTSAAMFEVVARGVLSDLAEKDAKIRAEIPPQEDTAADDSWLENISKFIEQDQELDMLLYGLAEIPSKFRVRLFREIARKAKAIEETMAILDNNKSKIAEEIYARIGNFYEEAKRPYRLILISIKRNKKLIDKGNTSCLNDFADYCLKGGNL